MGERRASVGILTALILAWSRDAASQTEPSLDLRSWRPSSDPEASLVLEPPSTPGPWRWNVSAWTQYAHEPVALTIFGIAQKPVAHLVGADLVAGLGIGSRVAVGVDLPAFVWQDGSTVVPPTVLAHGTAALPASGLGDLSLRAKVTIVSDDRVGTHVGFGLASLGDVTLPTGDKASFMGDGDVTASLRLLAAYTLGPASLRASAGYAARTSPHAWPPAFGSSVCGLPCNQPAGPTFGASVPWAVGLTLRPKAVLPSLDAGDRQVWEIAAHGSLPAGPVAPFVDAAAPELSPALLAADDRVALGHYHDAYFIAGAEVGLDRAVGVPVFRGVLAIGWAPRSHDKDDDGVDDDADQCPELAEDRDGIQDEDGCPEDDADDDGVPDAQDACPLVPGVAATVPGRNGCPPAGAPK
jgi:OOP family OmpA-OmpF porin